MNMKQHIYSHILLKKLVQIYVFYVFYFEIIEENNRFFWENIETYKNNQKNHVCFADRI